MPESKRFSDEKLQQFYDEFLAHAEKEEERMAVFLKAFPHEDPISHRQYHEAVMRAAEAQEKFWSELRLDIAKKGVWGLVMILCGLVVAGAAVKMGIRP